MYFNIVFKYKSLKKLERYSEVKPPEPGYGLLWKSCFIAFTIGILVSFEVIFSGISECFQKDSCWDHKCKHAEVQKISITFQQTNMSC